MAVRTPGGDTSLVKEEGSLIALRPAGLLGIPDRGLSSTGGGLALHPPDLLDLAVPFVPEGERLRRYRAVLLSLCRCALGPLRALFELGNFLIASRGGIVALMPGGTMIETRNG